MPCFLFLVLKFALIADQTELHINNVDGGLCWIQFVQHVVQAPTPHDLLQSNTSCAPVRETHSLFHSTHFFLEFNSLFILFVCSISMYQY